MCPRTLALSKPPWILAVPAALREDRVLAAAANGRPKELHVIRIGVIGLGMMGRTHIEAYDHIEGAQLVAIADIDPKRAAGDFSGVWSNIDTSNKQQLDMSRIKGYTDPRKLIKSPDVDVVDICVPTPDHPKLAVAALKAGKHVLCEKPLARTAREGKRIVAAAKNAKGFFMPAMCIRFWPAYAWLKNAVAESTYGAVRSATFRRLGSPPPNWFLDGKQSGGALLDLHVHDVDFVNWVFGKPTSVYSRGYTEVTGAIDHVVTQYAYDDVPLVVTEGGWAFQGGFNFRMDFIVNFESATVAFENNKLMLSRAGKADEIHVDPAMGYQKELEYFLSCVRGNQCPTVVTAADALESVRIIEAELKSIQRGKPVKL
jgi:predicted dehydrogenase